MTKFCSQKSVTFCRRRRGLQIFLFHFCRPNTRVLCNSEHTVLHCSRALLRSESQCVLLFEFNIIENKTLALFFSETKNIFKDCAAPVRNFDNFWKKILTTFCCFVFCSGAVRLGKSWDEYNYKLYIPVEFLCYQPLLKFSPQRKM